MLRQRSNPLALATSSDGGLLRGFDGGSEAVVKMFSIRVVLGLAAALYLEIEQLDVKTAFLAHHGDLEEDIYMEQPEGLKVADKENLVWTLF